jgi:hypothetical protein
VPRGIFVPNSEEMSGGWRKLHNEELHDSYPWLNSIWVIKSKRLRGVGHAACMEKKRNAYRILVGKLEGKRPLEELHTDGRIMLNGS